MAIPILAIMIDALISERINQSQMDLQTILSNKQMNLQKTISSRQEKLIILDN